MERRDWAPLAPAAVSGDTCAAVSFALVDYFFTVPYNTFPISSPEDVLRQVLPRPALGEAYAQAQDAKFSVVSVRTRRQSDGEKEWMGGYASLTHQLGGDFVHLHGRSPARGIVDYVHQSLATEVVLGHRRRNRWLPGDTTSEVIRRLSGVDVHILRNEQGA